MIRTTRSGRACKLALLLLTAPLFGACSGEPANHHERMLVFGTVVEVNLYGADADEARRLLTDIEAQLEQRHRQWHAWEDGTLTRFNRHLNQHGTGNVPDELHPLFDQGLALAAQTDYRFDPGIGALVQAWGFHGETEDANAQPPDASTLERWRAQPHSAADLTYRDGHIKGADEGLLLDFGAVAKGVALEELRGQLMEASLDAAIINAGGDLVTIHQPGNREWRIGVRDPKGTHLVGTLGVRAQESVFTSGDYERGFHYDDTWYHHVLNPSTGEPARGLRAATVLADDPALADAASTALLVAGPQDWAQLAADLGLEKVLVIDDDRIHATEAMADRFDRDPDTDLRLRVVD